MFTFIAGLVFLVISAELLVRGASRLAAALGISPLIIGLTVVAFGTSASELTISVKATLANQTGIAVGNIFNIMAVLGIASMVASSGIPVEASTLRFDIPVMIAVALACLPIFYTDQTISHPEGIIFFAYYRRSRKSRSFRWGAIRLSTQADESFFDGFILIV